MNKLTNNIFKILIEIFIFDRVKRSKIKARWAKKHLAKYLCATHVDNGSVDNDETTSSSCSSKSTSAQVSTTSAPLAGEVPEQTKSEGGRGVNSSIIWQYWHQGKENAPDLIKQCFNSIQKFEGDKKIVVLSFDTVKDYVDIPQKYYDLVNSKKIPIAIFSDIVRLYLLEKYGGMWIDSTILLTEKIPQEVWDSDFCVFQKDPKTDPQENRMSCYFIRAKKGSLNLRAIRKSIENYWAKNDFLINYFMFEHISTMLSEKPELKPEWEKMPYLSAKDCGALQEIMYDNFSSNKFEEIKSKSFMHKLTYKKQPLEEFLKTI